MDRCQMSRGEPRRLPPQLFRRMLDKNSENRWGRDGSRLRSLCPAALLPCYPARPTPKDLSAAFSERPKRRKGERPSAEVILMSAHLSFTPLWKQAAPGAGSGGLSMTRASSAACGLPWLQDKNLLIPVTPPSDGGFGMGYTRAGTAVTIATRAKTSTGAYVCL